MKTYRGHQVVVSYDDDGGLATKKQVVVEEPGKPFEDLPPRLDLWDHSPSGYEWGYGGSGPAQLALALLADVLENDEEAVRLHQAFKVRVVAKLPRDKEWVLTENQIRYAALMADMAPAPRGRPEDE